MLKILKYSFFDLIRSRWSLYYCAFYLLLTFSLFWLNTDISKVIITLMNIVLFLVPLVATVFGVMYYYNSREFVELLLAQPIKRTDIFIGQYLGIASSLSLSLLIGIGLPFILYGVFASAEIWDYFTLLLTGLFLSMIFSGIAFLVALKFENKIKGFGTAIFIWLFFAIIYDGLFLLILSLFNEYPLEKVALGFSIANPIDLSRILILLKLDISALMGFAGAVFQNLLGSMYGLIAAILMLSLWVWIPVLLIKRTAVKKDF